MMSPPSLPQGLDQAALDRLLHAYGIAGEFIEFSGNVKQIPLAQRYHMLQAMGRAPGDAAALDVALRAIEAAHFKALPPVLTASAEAGWVELWFPPAGLDQPCQWHIACEDGAELHGEALPHEWPQGETLHYENTQWQVRHLCLPALPFGYHRLRVEQGERRWQTLLLVAPERAWLAPALAAGKRIWGLSAQLYTLRSPDDCGIGDFSALSRLVELAAAGGAAFVLLNPLHALDPRYPENASPYSPSDRRFLNPLYIALQLAPGFSTAAFQALWHGEDTQQALAQARAAPEVAYSAVSALKYRLLEALYGLFIADTEAPEQAQFHAWRAQAGMPLAQFSAFQATLAPPGSVAASADYQSWLQWLAQAQLDACQARALAAGMALGLVRDLAVGSSVDGCEVLGNQSQYCLAARIGAPPDNFNPEGQNWGLPPLLPQALEADEFRLFRHLLRANMQACGALRIDHVLGLCRLWWCPNDGSNATGAYVHYQVDVLFAILRLESWRQRCVVIGEDLGVVPPVIRGYLENGGIYSNCVFYFEKYDDWHFRKPWDYKWQTLAMQANHDVAPLAAWWKGSDLELRHKLGLIADEAQLRHELDWRRGERGQLLQWLDEQQLLPANWQTRPLDAPLDAPLQLALTRALGHANAQLLSVQVDDLAGMELPVNIPGTSGEYANWRRKLPVDIDTIFALPSVQAQLAALRETRQG
ncbi:MAG: 4-alpha-glucanotransferase [Pseudomonadales bacterium]|jgi:4-alpha-glucanotransferase|nr:4-alpha-glucanotransferase [Pseudomonadales bacterium]